MAGDTTYWAGLYDEGRHLGGGFLVAPGVVLTAAHCVAMVPRDRMIEVRFSAAESVWAKVEEIADGDVALLVISAPSDVAVDPPVPASAGKGDTWQAPCRPADFEAVLTGSITAAGMDFVCADGSRINALQLLVAQELEDFSGYSGGPIEVVDGKYGVAGILLEQAPERARGERASNVLFGASLGEALIRFRRFSIRHLLGILGGGPSPMPEPPAPRKRRRQRSREEDTDVKLRALKQWLEDGIVTPLEAEPLRIRIIDKWLGTDE